VRVSVRVGVRVRFRVRVKGRVRVRVKGCVLRLPAIAQRTEALDRRA